MCTLALVLRFLLLKKIVYEGVSRNSRTESITKYALILIDCCCARRSSSLPSFFPSRHGSTGIVGLGIIVEVSRSRSVVLLWMSDRSVAETST
jgi:hypothetical protein